MNAAAVDAVVVVPDDAEVFAIARSAAAAHLHLVIDHDGKAKLTPKVFPGMQEIHVDAREQKAGA